LWVLALLGAVNVVLLTRSPEPNRLGCGVACMVALPISCGPCTITPPLLLALLPGWALRASGGTTTILLILPLSTLVASL
jgi:hypothetical protein